ncbi:hypothetical protein QN382_19880 [Pseudomonas sp. 10B1]|uniref:hypothetical protein n=1 Tax=Pseudomonas sp. 10B1 TaxID=3048573 RepID=UPI002B231574|nr:hypothetical protein [Pseudomonas sp. 10B1]MEB0311537.1 hypothetical protein [Pseudomonas sp. 10B1]
MQNRKSASSLCPLQQAEGQEDAGRMEDSLMANPWFRMYSEFATDPKVQMMTEPMQRRYLMLLCIKCGNGDETLQDDQIAFQLRISDADWLTTKASLMSKNLIDEDAKPVAWNKRQYVSDTSTTRVAAHREKKKRSCNVSVTPPDTDSDTDSDSEKTPKVDSDALFASFWKLYPRKVSKDAAQKAWGKLNLSTGLFNTICEALAKHCLLDDWAKGGGQFVPHASTWINGRRWTDEMPTSNVHQFPIKRQANGPDFNRDEWADNLGDL